MTSTTEKIGGFSVGQLKSNAIVNGIQFIAKREECIEIIDRRCLSDRFDNEIKGPGVKRTFGVTHFVVTENLYKKLTNIQN